MAAVDLKGVVKSYDGKLTVIHGIDLQIKHGEFVVFVGPSGCGKSTLLRMIAGLETISGGEVSIDGHVVNDLPPRARDIAMVFQDYALYPHKNLYDNMAFGLRLRKTPEAEIKQRVMDAAIVRQPKVFLFDEPLSNLDAQLRHEMRSEIKRLHQRLGATIIYVTHDQVEAMTMADRIAVLSAGKKMQYDTPDNIYNHPAALFVAGFTGAPPMNLADCTLAGGRADLGGTQITLPSDLAARGNGSAKLKFGIRPENITLARQSDTDLEVPAEVSLLEPLGAETLVLLKIGNTEMTARCNAAFRDRPGTKLTVHMNPSHLHLFDATSGTAL
jgi:multiple sugar transport system ATP-binding protein